MSSFSHISKKTAARGFQLRKHPDMRETVSLRRYRFSHISQNLVLFGKAFIAPLYHNVIHVADGKPRVVFERL